MKVILYFFVLICAQEKKRAVTRTLKTKVSESMTCESDDRKTYNHNAIIVKNG